MIVSLLRYLESPWLCNLDWSTKKFRGKSKKSDMKKLLDELERHYQERDEEFRLAGQEREGGEGGGEGGEARERREGEGEGEEGEARERREEGGEGGEGKGEESSSASRNEFFISGDGPTKRAVHMPGYPE